VAQVPDPDGDVPPPIDRRTFLAASGAAVLALAPGCVRDPSSGGPAYESCEVDDGPVFEPGLTDELERGYYAALVADERGARAFDRTDSTRRRRPSSTGRTSAWSRPAA